MAFKGLKSFGLKTLKQYFGLVEIIGSHSVSYQITFRVTWSNANYYMFLFTSNVVNCAI